ncbi:peptidase, M28 family, partial [Ancylostoma duodenale]
YLERFQRPTGCFDLKFLSSFTLCYEKITNIVVRIGPASGPTHQSLLLNCHYDTMPDTPGATDDAVSCAIMMDVLNVLSQSEEPLKNDVIFLFNGAEENFLQGAHGFIESHPWRHTIHAFINLEGTGSGGREILFQAGPGNSWLLQTYLEAAPHPFCSVLAQEIFQSGIIPSDTDFRIFRDHGRISGLDIAYTKNGWVYHTEFDEEWRIEAGAIQSFTLCYEKITNIVVRIGPASGPTHQSLLLNCHYDTMPDTPGATDDAVSCAIMMDVLNVLSQSEEPLKNDVIFLFNAAEENFLQGAHGFIESHPWRHAIHAFINLEGTGSGGREILFQAGPGNSWLLQTYLEAAPHPFCSVLAQEIFQSGIIPSDTDFRIFRDHGRISGESDLLVTTSLGLDIAYTKNGWVYHTEFDEEWRIEAGAIQRAGENVLAVVRAILESPYLVQAASFDEANKWVFYDVVGLFTIFYTVTVGQILNYGACAVVAGLVAFRILRGAYTLSDLGQAFWHHICAFFAMILTMVVVVVLVLKFDLLMCWYKLPEIVGPLYVLPMLIVGCTVHTHFADKTKIRNIEMVQYDSIVITYAVILFVMTSCHVASAFFVFNYVVFPLLKDPLIFVLGVTPRVLLFTQLVCFAPVFVFAVYAISQCVDFFVPVMGRLGNAVNPELVMAPIGLAIASSFVLFVNNLFYVSRRMNYLIKCGCAIFVFFFIALVTTRLGVPYEYSDEHPRLRRIIALHTNRTIHDFEGNVVQKDNGLFVQSLDFRGAEDLPAHSFLQGSTAPNCTSTKDEYCRLPYYAAIHELFPPERSIWVPVPSPAPVPHPIKLTLIDRVKVGANRLNMTFELRGGYDKMSLHITPLSGYELLTWSFTNIDIEEFGRRTTYFVFMTYGFEMPEIRRFWILLENPAATPSDPENTHNVEIAVAAHHAH